MGADNAASSIMCFYNVFVTYFGVAKFCNFSLTNAISIIIKFVELLRCVTFRSCAV